MRYSGSMSVEDWRQGRKWQPGNIKENSLPRCPVCKALMQEDTRIEGPSGVLISYVCPERHIREVHFRASEELQKWMEKDNHENKQRRD